MVKLSIITISTNELHFLKKFYFSLKEYEKNNNYELIIVDNASTDNTFEWFKTNAPEVKIIRNRKKQGFAFNNNLGIKRSNGEFILIINPDVIFIEPFIDETTRYLEEHKDIGLLHCKLLNPDMTVQYSVRRFYSYTTLFARRFPYFRDFLSKSSINKKHLYLDQDFNKIFYPDWVLGAFMMFPREITKKVGFLDERFTLYFEDVDFCKRIWNGGYKIVYYPYKKLIHLYNRESDTKKFFEGFKLKRGAKLHLESMTKYLIKYKYKLGR